MLHCGIKTYETPVGFGGCNLLSREWQTCEVLWGLNLKISATPWYMRGSVAFEG